MATGTVAERVIEYLTAAGRPVSTAEVTEGINASAPYVRDVLTRLRDSGTIAQPRRGFYAIPEAPDDTAMSGNGGYRSNSTLTLTDSLLGKDFDGFRAPVLRVLGRTQSGDSAFQPGAQIAPFAVARDEAHSVYGIDARLFTGFRIPNNLLAPAYRRGEPVGVTTYGDLDPRTGEPAGVPLFDAVSSDGRYLLRSGSMYLLRAVQVIDSDTLRLYTHREGDQEQIVTREAGGRYYVLYKIELALAAD